MSHSHLKQFLQKLLDTSTGGSPSLARLRRAEADAARQAAIDAGEEVPEAEEPPEDVPVAEGFFLEGKVLIVFG